MLVLLRVFKRRPRGLGVAAGDLRVVWLQECALVGFGVYCREGHSQTRRPGCWRLGLGCDKGEVKDALQGNSAVVEVRKKIRLGIRLDRDYIGGCDNGFWVIGMDNQ